MQLLCYFKHVGAFRPGHISNVYVEMHRVGCVHWNLISNKVALTVVKECSVLDHFLLNGQSKEGVQTEEVARTVSFVPFWWNLWVLTDPASHECWHRNQFGSGAVA